MKMYYVVNARMPTERAHGIQIAKMCEALGAVGDITLVLPRRRNTLGTDVYGFYAVRQTFKIKRLPVIDFVHLGRLGFLLETLSFGISAWVFLLFQPRAVVYMRGEMVMLARFLRSRFFVFWESHIKPEGMRRYMSLFKYLSGVVVVTQYYRKELGERFGVPEEKILLAPDAVDLNMFDQSVSKEMAREKLGIQRDIRIVLYSGSGLDWKGVETIVDAVPYFPEQCQLFLLGKHDKKDVEGVVCPGQRPYHEVPLWLAAADVLVLGGNKNSETSRFYTSPLKLFEYMAAARPIVAPDLPSIRDVLSENEAFLYEANNPRSLSLAVKRSLDEPESVKKKTQRSLEKVKGFSWEQRAAAIISFLHNQKGRGSAFVNER